LKVIKNDKVKRQFNILMWFISSVLFQGAKISSLYFNGHEFCVLKYFLIFFQNYLVVQKIALLLSSQSFATNIDMGFIVLAWFDKKRRRVKAFLLFLFFRRFVLLLSQTL